MRANNAPSVPKAITSEDHEYVKMMFEEQAEHARLHEELRGISTSIFLALIAGILAFAVGEHSDALRKEVSGICIFGISVIGAIVSYKHYERYNLHLTRYRNYRKSLQHGLSPGISDINEISRMEHNKKYWFSHYWIRLHWLWPFIYLLTALIGGGLIFGMIV